MTGEELKTEVERQVQNLIDKEYPKIAGISQADFRKLLRPLEEKAGQLKVVRTDLENGYLPFVIVVKSGLIRSEVMMESVRFNDKEGITKLTPLTAADFHTLEKNEIPKSDAYLLVDIDRGKETLNVRPEDALTVITSKHRFPLTIDEGIAVVTQYPEFLIKNNCFSLLGSRTGKDQRVPAIWINAGKQANLGWCWDRNPHTWLGSGSVKTRIGI